MQCPYSYRTVGCAANRQLVLASLLSLTQLEAPLLQGTIWMAHEAQKGGRRTSPTCPHCEIGRTQATQYIHRVCPMWGPTQSADQPDLDNALGWPQPWNHATSCPADTIYLIVRFWSETRHTHKGDPNVAKLICTTTFHMDVPASTYKALLGTMLLKISATIITCNN